MADEYTMRRVLRELAECAGVAEPSDSQVATYLKHMGGIENAQLIAALPRLKGMAKRRIPTAGQVRSVAERQKFTLHPVKAALVDMFGNVVEATFSGSNRPRYCRSCKRVMAGDRCSLCEAGAPAESLFAGAEGTDWHLHPVFKEAQRRWAESRLGPQKASVMTTAFDALSEVPIITFDPFGVEGASG